ncbi:MAG: hypothetical protein PHH54_03305 [Candidatus Nanoarchaeia archaeon]|nr:hypothetical protein [Candidatus Nanoarchaeia archaeon]MDD5740984.1 hypothetical protein [Candidatus Nanoarchaeia archaeon]
MKTKNSNFHSSYRLEEFTIPYGKSDIHVMYKIKYSPKMQTNPIGVSVLTDKGMYSDNHLIYSSQNTCKPHAVIKKNPLEDKGIVKKLKESLDFHVLKALNIDTKESPDLGFRLPNLSYINKHYTNTFQIPLPDNDKLFLHYTNTASKSHNETRVEGALVKGKSVTPFQISRSIYPVLSGLPRWDNGDKDIEEILEIVSKSSLPNYVKGFAEDSRGK